MRLIYTGPHPGVELVLPSGDEIPVAKGQQIEVSDEHGVNLLLQVHSDGTPNWQRPAGRPPAPAAKSDSDEKE